MSMTTRCFDCLGTAKCSSCGGSGAAATGVRCHCEGKAARCVRCNGTGFEIPEKGCTRCSGKGGCLSCSGTGSVDLAKAIRMRQERERQARQEPSDGKDSKARANEALRAFRGGGRT